MDLVRVGRVGAPHLGWDEMTFHEAQADPVLGAPAGCERTQVYPTPFGAIWHAVGSVAPAPIGLRQAHWTNMGADARLFTGT